MQYGLEFLPVEGLIVLKHAVELVASDSAFLTEGPFRPTTNPQSIRQLTNSGYQFAAGAELIA